MATNPIEPGAAPANPPTCTTTDVTMTYQQCEDLACAASAASSIRDCIEIILSEISGHVVSVMLAQGMDTGRLSKAVDMLSVAERLCIEQRSKLHQLQNGLDAASGEGEAK